ncbi:signal recognition particle 14 kDa protein [Striga asiatica]|uniref:Signal recognition particle 14 kDa protein n=1 Tax=Striga asiatica TaxID=4170 RepID=A0A5A7Q829_STRAF|nr:signal recognition particle 14 kDa protein [Striga asiatica]
MKFTGSEAGPPLPVTLETLLEPGWIPLRRGRAIVLTSRKLAVMMSRTYLPISQITDETRNWTALIQVVERAPIQANKSDSQVLYRRYLFSDGEKPHCTKLALTNYEFNWLLHKKTLVEEFQEKVSPPLPCQIEIHAFVDLNKYADTENPRSNGQRALQSNVEKCSYLLTPARKKPTTIASSDSAIKKRISFDNQ